MSSIKVEATREITTPEDRRHKTTASVTIDPSVITESDEQLSLRAIHGPPLVEEVRQELLRVMQGGRKGAYRCTSQAEIDAHFAIWQPGVDMPKAEKTARLIVQLPAAEQEAAVKAASKTVQALVDREIRRKVAALAAIVRPPKPPNPKPKAKPKA